MTSNRPSYIFLTILLFPAFLKAEGQDGLVLILDGFTFLAALFVWTILFFIIMDVTKIFRNKENGIKQKILIGLICLLLAMFQFIMTKSDSHPYEGSIDEFIHRDRIRADKIRAALEIWNGKPDSTIETTIASIDTNKIGIYIWLNGQSRYVRKLVPDLGSQQRNDSLTMSIVRTWKNKRRQHVSSPLN